MDLRYAQKIINIAKAEAQPAPYGKVNDFQEVIGKPNERFGWENLKGYFEVAGGFTEAHWKQKGQFNGEEITALDGVRLKNKRVPQKNTNKDGTISWSGTQWCGIFAVWCWIKAGVPNVKWGFPGVKGTNVRLVPDLSNPKNKDLTLADIGLGDIAVLKEKDPTKPPLVHHFLVTDIFPASKEIVTINGNSDYQGITTKTVKKSDVVYFYTVKDDFLNILRDLYGPGSEKKSGE
jgi:hypothetical protein